MITAPLSPVPISAFILVMLFSLTTTTAVAGIEADVIRAHGRVLDPDGEPLAGARVTIPSTATWETRLDRKPLAQTTTGTDGRFELSVKKADLSPFSTGGGSMRRGSTLRSSMTNASSAAPSR